MFEYQQVLQSKELRYAFQMQLIPVDMVRRQKILKGQKLQMKSVMQRQELMHKREILQMKKENYTILSENLKAGIDRLFGIDDLSNSSKPAEIGALTNTKSIVYTQVLVKRKYYLMKCGMLFKGGLDRHRR